MENTPAIVPSKGLERVDPEKEIEYASHCARVLKKIVDMAGLSKNLGGEKEYLEFEGWQTVSKFYGAGAKVEWTREIINGEGNIIGYNSRAVVIQNSEEIGAAEARCGRDEGKWNTRPKYEYRYIVKGGGLSKDNPGSDKIIWQKDTKTGKSFPKKKKVEVGFELVPLYQLESMSQTRAMAKALRSRFSWVVVLAGYSPTPAEEMEGVIDVEPTLPSPEESSGESPSSPPNRVKNEKKTPKEEQNKITPEQSALYLAEVIKHLDGYKTVFELRNGYRKHFHEWEKNLLPADMPKVQEYKDKLKKKFGDKES